MQEEGTPSVPEQPERQVSDEEIADYTKSLTVPRFGTPRVFLTSARQGACFQAALLASQLHCRTAASCPASTLCSEGLPQASKDGMHAYYP
jgi:hypothetical protein